MPTDTVGDRLVLALRRSGMEDKDVARLANALMGGDEHNKILGASWLSAVKNDRIKSPPIDKLRAVAEVTGTKLSYLTEPMGVIPIDECRSDDPLVLLETAIRLTPDMSDEDKQLATYVVRSTVGRARGESTAQS